MRLRLKPPAFGRARSEREHRLSETAGHHGTSKPFGALALRQLVGAAFAAIAISTSASPASAAGLFFSERGVRPLGRGGAFVAGADDAHSIYYNPAGLAFTGRQLLIDGSWMRYRSRYRRSALTEQVDPNTGQPTGQTFIETFPSVEGTTPFLLIPTVAYADPLGTDDFVFALGMYAPYAPLLSYPTEVNGDPAPQRYSMITLEGSLLAVVGAYASYRPIEELSIGGGIELLAGSFDAQVVLGGCVPERFFCAPEQPEFDAPTQLDVGPIVTPSGILGATLVPSDGFRLGASFHFPYRIDSGAKVDVRLPEANVFDGARQQGRRANVKFNLPWTARFGAEVRPDDQTAVEVAFVYEAWHMHDSIDLQNKDIALADVEAFPPVFRLADVSLQRGFDDAWSIRLGGERRWDVGDVGLGVRLGTMYETSAVPNPYLSAATVDVDKVTAAGGASLYVGAVRIDAVFAQIFGQSTTVDPADAQIYQVSPLVANPPERQVAINGGRYDADATVIGLGIAYTPGTGKDD